MGCVEPSREVQAIFDYYDSMRASLSTPIALSKMALAHANELITLFLSVNHKAACVLAMSLRVGPDDVRSTISADASAMALARIIRRKHGEDNRVYGMLAALMHISVEQAALPLDLALGVVFRFHKREHFDEMASLGLLTAAYEDTPCLYSSCPQNTRPGTKP